MATGTLTYTFTVGNSDGTISLPYTTTYDEEKNCTTVVFGECSHKYFCRSGYSTSAVTTITVTATDDASNSAQTIAAAHRNGTGGSSMDNAGTPILNTLVIQHKNTTGAKSVKILGSTRIITYPTGNATQTSEDIGGGEITVASGTRTTTAMSSSAFVNRSYGLSYAAYRAWWATHVIVATIPYTTTYNSITNQTTVTFAPATFQYTPTGMSFSGTTTITIAPTDNTSDVKTVTLTLGSVSHSKAARLEAPTSSNYSSNTVVIQHASDNVAEKGITVSATSQMELWIDGSEAWKQSLSYSSTFATGMAFQGFIYIDNGSGYDAYQVYIDNGTGWDLYIPYIDNGSSWDICG